MAVHMISYDLMTPGKNYDSLIAAIKALGSWARPLKSQWLVVSSNTQAGIRDYLKQYVDANDRVFVVTIDRQTWASMNLPADVVQWLHSNVG